MAKPSAASQGMHVFVTKQNKKQPFYNQGYLPPLIPLHAPTSALSSQVVS
jgi:hypothetical protein